MRYIPQKDQHRRDRVARRRFRRKVIQRRRRQDLRRRGLRYHDVTRAPPGDHGSRIAVVAPPTLSLKPGSYARTMAFFNQVRKAALKDQYDRVVFDLRHVVELSPEVAPLLLAEAQRIKFLRGSEAVSGISPIDPFARRLLHLMDFFNALAMFDPESLADAPVETVFRIESGTSMDGSVSKALSASFGEALELGADVTERVQKVFNEALENISEHAYYDPTKLVWPAESKRWWICAITSQAQHGAYMIACDLGMTIPATIEETVRKRGPENVKAFAAYLKSQIHLTKDEQYLGAAFQDGVTRRAEKKGGRGLGKMASLVNEFAGGHLTVISGGAMAIIRNGATEVALSRLRPAFAGTFVIWHLTTRANQDSG